MSRPLITVTALLVNGDLWDPYDDGAPCNWLVEMFCDDDLCPPPTSVIIKVATASGRLVELRIPNSSNGKATVRID